MARSFKECDRSGGERKGCSLMMSTRQVVGWKTPLLEGCFLTEVLGGVRSPLLQFSSI